MRHSWRMVLVTASAVGAAVVLPAPTGAAPPSVGLSESSLNQIDALTAEKLARTADQRKVDSPLLAAAEQAQGRVSGAAPHLMPTVEKDGAGRTTLEVEGDLDSALLKRIEELGGDLLANDPESGMRVLRCP